MSPAVQTFSCPRCRRGEFRSLPDPDGKVFCPWCGDAVNGTAQAPPPPAAPAPEPPLPAAGSGAEPALQDRLAEMTRRCEKAESELRQELEKKEAIKRVVKEEVGRLGSQVGETQVRLQKKDEEHRAALAEAGRLREELEKERAKAGELDALRGKLDAAEKAAFNLQAELDAVRKAGHGMLERRDEALRDVERLRSENAKLKSAASAEIAELRKRNAAHESRLAALKDVDARLNELKAQQTRAEKERADLQGKAAALQAEVEKRDQRIRELQLLIKTLGERLNDLTSRRF